jgi:hypothetical protein
MLGYLLVSDYLLLQDLLSDCISLLFLFPGQLLLLSAYLLIVLEVTLFLFLFRSLMILHLFQQFLLDACLVLSQALFHSIFLLLELFNIVHNDLGPVIVLFLSRSKTSGGLLEDLRACVFNCGRVTAQRGLREGFIS